MATRIRNPVVKEPKRTIKSLSARVRKQKLSTIERLAENSASHIQRLFGVSKNDVVGELIQTILLSDKKHPEPTEDILTENGNKKTKKYIEYLWKYYECPKKKVKQKSTKKPTTSTLSELHDLVVDDKTSNNKKKNSPPTKPKHRIKPTVDIYLSTQEVEKDGQVTIRWESENATKVVNNNFGLEKPSKKTTGSLVDYKIKTRKTYYIVVENDFGDTARDEIDLELINPDLDTLKNAIEDAKSTPNNEVGEQSGSKQNPEENKEEQEEPGIVSNRSRVNLGGSQINRTLEDIKKITEDILTNLTNQSLFDKQVVEFNRKEAEKQKRSKRENLMEAPKKLASQLMNSKIMAPIKSLWDWLVNFIVFTILGRTFKKVMDWATDPKNKDKVESLKQFFSDFGPALLATFILFGTGFGKFIRSTVGLVVKMSKFILTKGIPGLIRMFKNLGPKGKIAAAVIVGGIGTKMLLNQLYKNQDGEDQTDKKPTSTSKRQEQIKENSKSNNFKLPTKRGGGAINKLKNNPFMDFLNPDKANVSDLLLDDTGIITKDSGEKIRGAGKDTQLIAAQPGEVVISKSAVDYFGGPDYFLKMNQMGGGTNKQTFANNIQLAAGGGLVGGNVNNKPSFNNKFQIAGGGVFNNLMQGASRLFGINSSGSGKPKIAPTMHGPPTPAPEHKTKEVQALLRTLRVAEGTIKSKNSYDTVYGGKMIPIRQMTVKELIDTQMSDKLPKRLGGGSAPWPKGSVASGAYQFMPHTLKELIKRKVLKPSDVMTPDTQDRAAWALAKNRGITLKELKKEGLSRNVMNKIAPEWASIPTKEGKSYYSQPVKTPSLLQKTYQQSLEVSQQANLKLPDTQKSNALQISKQFPLTNSSSASTLSANNIQRLPINSPTIGQNKNLSTVSVMNLPDIITNQSGNVQNNLGTALPEFSAVAFGSDRATIIADLGIA